MDRQQVIEDLDDLITKTEKELNRLQEETKKKKQELKSYQKARKAIPGIQKIEETKS